MAKEGKDRQADLVKRREAEGLKQYRSIWGYPEDEAAVKEFNRTRVELRRIERDKAKR